MNDIIRDWISKGCPYWDGVGIYDQLGNNQAIKNILQLGSTSFFQSKLKDAMMELLSQGEEKTNQRIHQKLINPSPVSPSSPELPETPSPKSQKSQKTTLISYRSGDIYLLPSDVGQLIKLKGQSYKDAATLHATLLKGKDPAKRKSAAFQILRLMAINQNCWAKLNYFDKYGALPIDQQATDYTTLNTGERDLFIQRHRVYLSRHRWLLQPDAIEHPKYLHFSAEYTRRKKELEELEKDS
jgi:hypothetical protein